jgi:hypothetical protein
MKDQSTEEALQVIETFDALPVERRLEIFRNLSPEAREQLMELVQRPQEIVRRISAEEVYFTIKALGEENAPFLIRSTTGRQLQYLLDLDLWKKDMFDTRSAGRWLEIISRMGEEKILQLVQVVDPELLVTVMNRLIRVVIRNPDIDLVEQHDTLPLFTLEDLFFIDFRFREYEEEMKNFLETIFRWNIEYYFGLMEELARGVQLESEEAAKKWRQARLADKGFPEFDEALAIYQYLKRQAVSSPDIERSPHDSGDSGETRAFLGYPLKLIDSNSLFKRCLDEISDQEEKDRLTRELAHLANKVIVADARDPGSVEELQGSLKKVSGYINIALEDMCGSDLAQALGLLRSNHLEILFRRGFSLILDLRKDAQKLIREYEGGVENLGYPLAGLVKGLFQKRPFYAGNVLGEEKVREFEQLEDLVRIRNMMDRTELEDRWEPV